MVREGYKETELGEIPVEWEVKSLGDIFLHMKSGLSRMLKTKDVGIPCIRSTNIVNGKINTDEIKYWFLEDDKGVNIKDYILDDGDILVNFINSIKEIGKACIYRDIGRDVIYTTNIFRIKVDKEFINNQFFYYFISGQRYKKEIQLITKPAVNQASFTSVEFKKIKTPVPPLPEQQKIASILSTVDKHIENTEKLIDKTKELKKGLMQILLTKGIGHTKFKKTRLGEIPVKWEVENLGSILVLCTNGIAEKQNTQKKGIKVSRIETISEGKINIKKVGWVNSKTDLSNYKLEVGDILFSNINSVKHIGKVAYVDKDYGIYHGMNLLRLRVDKKSMNSNFLYFSLSSTKMKNWFERNCKQAINQASLSQSDIKRSLIAIPPLLEQQKIASILLSIDEQIENYETKKEKLQELKKGLMQQLLTGKIRVKV